MNLKTKCLEQHFFLRFFQKPQVILKNEGMHFIPRIFFNHSFVKIISQRLHIISFDKSKLQRFLQYFRVFHWKYQACFSME
jgi:hypothetical protein